MNYNFNKVDQYCKNKGIKIVNCTVGGNLHNFERAELKSYLRDSLFKNAEE